MCSTHGLRRVCSRRRPADSRKRVGRRRRHFSCAASNDQVCASTVASAQCVGKHHARAVGQIDHASAVWQDYGAAASTAHEAAGESSDGEAACDASRRAARLCERRAGTAIARRRVALAGGADGVEGRALGAVGAAAALTSTHVEGHTRRCVGDGAPTARLSRNAEHEADGGSRVSLQVLQMRRDLGSMRREDILGAGHTLAALQPGGYTAQEARGAGFSLAELRDAGCGVCNRWLVG